jgi:hypothetical protein
LKYVLLAVLILSSLAAAFLRFRPPSLNVTATVLQNVLVKDAVPFGVDLGIWTFWGAEQLMSNIVKNPGFEGLIDGAIVLPVHAGNGNFDDSPAWLARTNAFWEGARYSVRSGTNAGAVGRISHSTAKNFFGLPSFTTEPVGPMPDPGEAVALSRERDDALPTQWWYSRDAGNSFSPERAQKRPGSPGSRSLRITSGSGSPAEVASYFDTIGDRAGKLLPLAGQWTLTFWAKLDRGRASLKAVVGREGSQPVLSESVPLSAQWTQFRLRFDGTYDEGPAGTLALRFQVSGTPSGDVLLDDVDLQRDSDAGFPFRAEVVATLKTLHPAYLRDWEGQLGDTLANRTASVFARKSWRYRPGDDTHTDFGYGLGDFLELAQKVGAAPWIVIPTVFTDEECAGLGSWLATPGRLVAGREVLVEFGNENWNELFRPAGISDLAIHGPVADRCLTAVREHSRGLNLKTVVNAKFANAEQVGAYGDGSPGADIVAVAPYFAFSMTAGLSLAKRSDVLFGPHNKAMKRMASDLRGIHKELAVYEVNLHTMSGTASEAERAPVVAGLASGAALARTLLDALSHGIRRQCVYSFTGFDARLEAVPGHARLWGIVRDLRAPDRLRPTGLALKMLNETVGGRMLEVDSESAGGVSVYAFESKEGISLVAASGTPQARRLTVKYPPGRQPTGVLRMTSLTGLSALSTNEDTVEVTIRTGETAVHGQTASFMVEPWSLVVVRPDERGPGTR